MPSVSGPRHFNIMQYYFSGVVNISKYPRDQLIIGSLSNNDGHVNENGKSNRFSLAKQQLYKCITLFVHFFESLPSLQDYDVKMPTFTWGSPKQKTTTFLFFSWTSMSSFKIANIWWIKRDGISAIKFEVARLHFLSGVFVAVAVRLLLKLPNKRGDKLLWSPDRITFVTATIIYSSSPPFFWNQEYISLCGDGSISGFEVTEGGFRSLPLRPVAEIVKTKKRPIWIKG